MYIRTLYDKDGEIYGYKAVASYKGQKRTFTRRKKKAAEKAWGWAIEDFEAGLEPYDRYKKAKPVDDDAVTFRAWTEDWQEGRLVEPNTADTAASILKTHILPVWGDQNVNAIRRLAVQRWVTGMVRDPGTSDWTIIGAYKLFRQIMADAEAEGLIDVTPCRRITGVPDPPPAPERILTPGQVLVVAERMRAASKLAGERWYLTVILLAWTGLRWSEFAGARRQDLRMLSRPPVLRVDEPLKRASVAELARRRPGEKVERAAYHGEPKTERSKRSVQLPRFLADLVAAELTTHKSVYVVPNAYGNGAASRFAFAKALAEAAAEFGGATPHTLRHCHRTWLEEATAGDGDGQRVHAAAIDERLGHAPGKEAKNRYVHVTDAMRATLMTTLDDLFVQARKDARKIKSGARVAPHRESV